MAHMKLETLLESARVPGRLGKGAMLTAAYFAAVIWALRLIVVPGDAPVAYPLAGLFMTTFLLVGVVPGLMLAFLAERDAAAADASRRRTEGLEREVAGHRRAERLLREMQAHLSDAQEIASIGSWDCDLSSGLVHCSPELLRIYGKAPDAPAASYEQFLSLVHPDDRDAMRLAIDGSRSTHKPFSYYHRIKRPDGSVRVLHGQGRVVAANGGPAHIAGTSQDVTDRKATEGVLAVQALKLERSNSELRQFAYVASHDLQEPLRTVAAFSQLLQEKYAGRLDKDADEIIGFVADGARHMQALVGALLAYFRVTSREVKVETVDSAAVLSGVVSDMYKTLSDAGATVTHVALPHVQADAALLADVFTNLLANAVKYRSAAPPRIQVWASRTGGLVEFAVSDNGIGIDPRHHERIFRVFQRLHTRDAYPGTGIGLSICQRIVERFGGRIWLESAPGKGAVFHFTLPAAAA